MSKKEPKESISEIRSIVIQGMHLIYDLIPHHLLPSYDRFLYYESEKGIWIIDTNDTWLKTQMMGEIESSHYNSELSGNQIYDFMKKYKIERAADSFDNKYYQDNFTKFSQMKTDHIYYNLNNGVLKYDLQTQTMVLQDRDPNKKFTSYLKVDYNPNAKCDLFLKTLDEIIPNEDDQEIFRYFLAYSLINRFHEWQTALLLYGIGHNGKSTIIHPITKLFEKVSFSTLDEISEPFGKAPLKEADIIIANESNKSINDLSNLKKIIAGETTRINPKFQQPYDALIDAKAVITANKLPNLKDRAELRRFLIIRTPTVFEGKSDPYLKDKLEKELPGIFNWIIKYTKPFLDNLPTLLNGIVQRNEKLLEMFRDPFLYYYDRYIYESSDDFLTISDFTTYYNEYAKIRKVNTMSNDSVGRRLKKLIHHSNYHRYTNERGYQGFAINKSKLYSDINPNKPTELHEFFDPERVKLRELFKEGVKLLINRQEFTEEKLYSLGETLGLQKDFATQHLNKLWNDGLILRPKPGIIVKR